MDELILNLLCGQSGRGLRHLIFLFSSFFSSLLGATAETNEPPGLLLPP